MKKILTLTLAALFTIGAFAQDDIDDDQGGSVIQNLTPSKLIVMKML